MLEKVMQNGAKITKNDAKMVPTLFQNRSKIDANIDSKIDAKFVVEKSIKNLSKTDARKSDAKWSQNHQK